MKPTKPLGPPKIKIKLLWDSDYQMGHDRVWSLTNFMMCVYTVGHGFRILSKIVNIKKGAISFKYDVHKIIIVNEKGH